MTDRPKDDMDGERIARGIRDLPQAGADPAFRSRLRSAFVSGELAGREKGEAHAHAHRPSARWRWLLIPPVAVAAAVVLVMLLNPGPQLRVLGTTGEGYLRIGDTEMLLSDRTRINKDLAPGVELSLPPNTSLDLIADGVVLYEVVGGTRMTVPATPGRWFGRDVEFSLSVGEIRMKTGPGFSGNTARIHTPDGTVVVTGTLLSVQCDDGGTCVCVLEGTASVGKDEAHLERVPPGQRKIMLKNGTIDIIPVKPMHRDGVLEFDARVGHQLGR